MLIILFSIYFKTIALVGTGRDYAVVRDSNNHNFLLWTVYLNYVEFREDINLR